MEDNKMFPMLAKTFQGLEDVLRDELISLGARDVETGCRMVSFKGDLEMLYRANLCCRTALKILRPIEKFTASNPDELYDMVRDIDWSRYMSADTTFAIDATVNSADFPHSKFAVYRVKDGIVDHFRDRDGRRPSIRLQGADLQLDVHIAESRVTISLNSSGEPLCRRGYRVESTEAPINEVLAAGIIMKTGWRGDSLFLDPMCGSGTFAIEAALIAANINPGIFRESYAFEKWADFDRDLFERLYNDDSEEREPSFPIIASDIDPEAVAAARRNIRAARLEDVIKVECRDFTACTRAPEGEPGIIVTNPPYSERLKPEDPALLFRQTGTVLKRFFGGYHAWILGYRDEDFAGIGLKPSVKYPINNGGLECTLREYVLFEGAYDDFRADGGSVRNETFERKAPRKLRRTSDSGWEEETREFSSRRERKPFDRDRKPFDRDSKPYDRDRKPFDRDRKPFDRERKPYDRDRKPYDRDRKPFDRERKPFDRDSKPFDRDRKPYDRDRKPFDRDRKPFDRDRRPESAGYRPSNRGPEIDDDHKAFDAGAVMRSRKVWRRAEADPESDPTSNS